MTRILYFTAAWCGPCRKFGPLLTKEAEARGLAVERFDLDDDRGAAVAASYGVQSVPTVIVQRRDAPAVATVVDRFGALAPSALRDHLDAACGR